MKLSQILIPGLALLAAMGATARAGTYKHITVDGSFADWAGVPVAYTNPSYHDDPTYTDDPASFATVTDFKALYVAHDDDYLYVRFTLYSPGDPFTSHNNVFTDADGDFTTGFGFGGLLGSEMLIQSGAGYQEKNGGFNDGFGINNLGWAAAPAGAATDFEFRISRQASFASDDLPVFTSPTIAFLLEAENAQFATKDKLPVDQAQSYEFTAAPPLATADVTLATLSGTTWKVNSTGTDLGTAWRETDYDDTQAGWTSGQGLFGFTPNAGAYPAAIKTAFPANHTTYYLRTSFDWATDTKGVILVITNYLSDGAVFYLNGAEVKRVRLPDGDITAASTATGGPSAKGQPELIGLAPDSLVVGSNTLAVEVHQTAGDQTDLVFGLSLNATIDLPVVLTDPSQPADRALASGDAVTFAAAYIGNPPFTFQWFKNDLAITDATNATYTINPVLLGDVGGYSLRIGNPYGPNVLTRSALLTVTNTPVSLTDATLPADTSVVEGLPVTLTVAATGSAPVSFQWFKNALPLVGETNATYSLTEAQLGDAGDYYALVSNEYPSTTNSRTAHLSVTKDLVAPTITGASGAATHVTVTFSEPISAASASDSSHFAISGGLTVTAAAPDPANASAVVLTTGSQTLGTKYTLTVNGVADRFGNTIAANSKVTFQSTIIIDGSFDDWASVPLAFTDAQDSTDSLDYKDVYVTSDEHYIYIRVTTYAPGDLLDYHNNLFVDADNDPTTGYSFAGIRTEMLIQSGAGYQEKNGGFNEGGINGLDFLAAPAAPASEFEFRISRSATYANDGLPVFASGSIAFALESENAGFATKDIAPDTGGFAYTFPASTEPGVLSISLTSGNVVVSWTGPGHLQSTDSLAAGPWLDVAGAANPYTVAPTGSQVFYRLAE
ncbi:MAG TPA: Ig-like domain-containing protein [Candidatus Limnocylindria bacterium]|nr:Ig-like domain-containing protein [Candidatus Limnocylindria bacterium]